MGGDCSQKLLPWRGMHSSPRRGRSSDRYETNCIAKIRRPRARLFSSPCPPLAAGRGSGPSTVGAVGIYSLTSFRFLPPVSEHRSLSKSVPSWLPPVTATDYWRCGPIGPAKMAPSPAAANTLTGFPRTGGHVPGGETLFLIPRTQQGTCLLQEIGVSRAERFQTRGSLLQGSFRHFVEDGFDAAPAL